MANTIKIKRGLSTDLNNASLQQGELAMTTDTYNLYVGVGSGDYIKIGGGPKNISDGEAKYSVRTINSASESDAYKLGECAFAEGKHTKASGEGSHAEGMDTTASGNYSHAEGLGAQALGFGSHAEGFQTTASRSYSHAEGDGATASGDTSHAEGGYTTASGLYSHAEGYDTTASGARSHAEGKGTTASGENQQVQGKYNIEDTTSAHIVGNGTADNKSNAHTLDWSGNAWFAGDVYTGSTSGTNKDEGSKKLATEEYVNNLVGSTDVPVNAIIEYEGATIPTGWESYTTDDAYTQTTLWHTTSWDNMLTPLTVKNLDMSSYDYVEVTFTGQGGTNSTTEILKIDLKEQFQIAMNIDNTSYMYGTSICFPDIQLLQRSNNDPGIFRIGALVSTDKKKLWVGDTGYFTGQTDSGNFDRSGIYARVSKIVGIKKINRIRKISQSTYSPSAGSEPKITVWSSSTPMITADNEEIRCIGSDGTVSSLLLSFLDTLTFTNSTKFSSSIVFKTSSSNCSFAVTPPTSVSLKMAGDDVTDGNFSPQSNKVYDIVFYWNGFYLNGIVKGTEVKTYEITVENGGSDSSYASFNIYTKEDASDLTTIEWSNSKKLTLTQDHLYIEYTAGLMDKCKEALNCELESVPSSDTYNNRYKVTITDSPAYVKFLCWQDGATV